MAIDFPDAPVVGDTYVYNAQTYEWNGTAWRLVRTSAVGPTGPTGPVSTVPGPTGPLGPTGPTGPASTVTGPTGPTGPAGTFIPSVWQTYTPTWSASVSDPTLGDGVLAGRYIESGSLVVGTIEVVAGVNGFNRGSGTYYLSLPNTAIGVNYLPVGHVVIRDEGPGDTYFGTAIFTGSNFSRIELWIYSQSGTYAEGAPAAADTPFFLGSNDKITVQFMYEKDIS